MKTLALIAACILASQTHAAEYFADALNGNDDWDGTCATHVEGTTSGPKRTLGAAVALADGTPTTVTALPGYYDQGEYSIDGQLNRVAITQPNLVIRSTEGKNATFIVGCHDPSTDSGIGPAGVRCVYITPNMRGLGDKDPDLQATNIVIRGFTICNGGTTGKGGGVYCESPDGGGAAMLVDCVVSNCVATRGGGMHRCNAMRTLFADNYCSENYGSAVAFGAIANCVVAYNRGESAVHNMRTAINCTFAYNEKYVVRSGYGMYMYNCLSFGNGNNGNSGSGLYFYHSVGAEPTQIVGGVQPESITNAVVCQCISPAFHDWRLISGSPAIGRGSGAWLTEKFVLPPGETHKDYLGHPIDTTKAIDCGAVQAPAVIPVGGRIKFGSAFGSKARFRMDGCDVVAAHGAYHYGTVWPSTLNLRYDQGSGMPLFLAYWKDCSNKEVRTRPDYDGVLHVTPPASAVAEQVLDVYLARQVLYADAKLGNDAWDGTAPTHEGGTVGPKRTLQAVADLKSEYAIVNVASGIYDAGGSAVSVTGGVSSNRLQVAETMGFVASQGRGTAVIKGAPDPETGGLGSNAVRCAWLVKYSFLQGIDLTGGYTWTEGDPSGRGGALNLSLGSDVLVCDCTISNNCAALCGASACGNFERVRFFDNHTVDGDMIRYAVLRSCVAAGNTSDAKVVLGPSIKAWGCTFDVSDTDCAITSGDAASYFFGCLLTPDGSGKVSPSSICNFWTNNPLFADPEKRDYRLGSLSAAMSKVDVDSYAGADDASRYLFADVDGNAISWMDGTTAVGACQVPVHSYSISCTGGGLTVAGGSIGTHVVTEDAEVIVTATDTARRPFAGFEVNGVLRPADETTLVLAMKPTDAGATVVKASYGSNWYVDVENGDDANSGGTLATAKKHICAATTNALSGDVVLVAKGVYADGETVQYHYDSVDDPYADHPHTFYVGSRVLVPAGVTLKSIDGPEQTVIVGRAAPSPDAYGNGDGAVRCVMLDENTSVLSGFTLTGGHTSSGELSRDDNDGGAVLSRDALIENCIISNNCAARSAAGYRGTFVDCRFFDNVAIVRAAIARESRFYRCVFDGNVSPEQMIQYCYCLNCCTFGPRNRTLTGETATAVGDISKATTVANSMFLCVCGNMPDRVDNCAFASEFACPAAEKLHNCVVVPSARLALDAACRPVVGSNDAIDAGNPELIDSRVADGKDLDGLSRIMNARMDIGAYEADWRRTYARDLGGRRLTTTFASPQVYEMTAHDNVRIPSGSMSFVLSAADVDNREFVLEFKVTGNGVFKLYVGNDPCREFTHTDEMQTLKVAFGSPSVDVRLEYAPGENDEGWAEVRKLHIERGLALLIR